MKISVITPTHNKRHLLSRTLDSLVRQDVGPGAFEVVVVNDGSTDDTADYLDTVSTQFTLKTVLVEENRGRAAARNRGLEHAEGELVVFLDDDMELTGSFLRAHRLFHQSRERVGGIGNVINHPEVVMAPIDKYMSTRGAQKIKDRGELPWKYFSTNNASVLREDLEAVGGFDENFVTYGFEDLELALRLNRERGIRFYFVGDARSLHIHPHTLKEVLDKKTLCGLSSLRYLFEKYPETREELGFHRFDPPRQGDPWSLNVQRAVFRLLLTRPVYTLVKPLAEIEVPGLTNLVLDYLVQYHYLEGLKQPASSMEVS